jgi:hypothetical protein
MIFSYFCSVLGAAAFLPQKNRQKIADSYYKQLNNSSSIEVPK